MDSKKIENIVILILIFAGIFTGIFLYTKGYKDISVIMFSIALASILYKFLGGIDTQNTFTLGAIKFGGSAAILGGFIFLLDQVVFVPNEKECTITVTPSKDWIPINIYTGEVEEVEIENSTNQKLTFPDSKNYVSERKSHKYRIVEKGNSSGEFYVVLDKNKRDTIGYSDLKSFQSASLFNNLAMSENVEMEIITLYPYGKVNSTALLSDYGLPFDINVFGTRFSIQVKGEDKPFIERKEVRRRTVYLLPMKDEVGTRYLIMTEQANHEHPDGKEFNFSKWIIMKIETTLS